MPRCTQDLICQLVDSRTGLDLGPLTLHNCEGPGSLKTGRWGYGHSVSVGAELGPKLGSRLEVEQSFGQGYV